MSAAALPPAALPRLGTLLRLLGSDQDGEALGAARAIGRVLAGFGLTLHDLAAAVERLAVERDAPAKPRRQPRAWSGDVDLGFGQRCAVLAALRRGLAGDRMTAWEVEFAASLVTRLQSGRGRLSERQAETLARILGKLGEAVPWA